METAVREPADGACYRAEALKRGTLGGRRAPPPSHLSLQSSANLHSQEERAPGSEGDLRAPGLHRA